MAEHSSLPAPDNPPDRSELSQTNRISRRQLVKHMATLGTAASLKPFLSGDIRHALQTEVAAASEQSSVLDQTDYDQDQPYLVDWFDDLPAGIEAMSDGQPPQMTKPPLLSFDQAKGFLPPAFLTAATALTLHQVIKSQRQKQSDQEASQSSDLVEQVEPPTPPITNQSHRPKTPFNFELAIQALTDAPDEQKLLVIKDIKEAYVNLRHKTAALQHHMIRLIEQNPDIELVELQDHLQSLLDQAGLPQSVNELAHQTLLNFEQRRQQVNDIRQQGLSSQQIIEANFGYTPQGQIDLEYLPIVIYATCHDKQDYQRLYGSQDADLTHGFYRQKSLFAFQNGPLDPTISKSVQTHEIQHALYDTIYNGLDLEHGGAFMLNGNKIIDLVKQTDNIEDWHDIVKDLFRQSRYQMVDPRAKDEVLAQITDPNKSSDYIIRTLLQPQAEGGVYDYDASGPAFRSQRYITKMVLGATDLQPSDGRMLSHWVEDARREVYNDEYSSLLQLSVEVVDNLTALGYPRSEVIQLLTLDELRHWPALERKLIDPILASQKR